MRNNEWLNYYQRFDNISPTSVRDGSHPQIFEQANKADKAIVLIHGLTDSPYYMRAVADFFFEQLGYDVYLPLLKGHGLKRPEGMTDVRLEDWKENINFAIETAAEKVSHISIGGLSTGGALSFYTAANDKRITGSLYLFSAALDLAGGPGGMLGEIAEFLLRTPLASLIHHFNKRKPLIGDNPFKYARMDIGGAIQLSRLIKETDRLMSRHHKREIQFLNHVFAAHSKGDDTAHIDGIKAICNLTDPTLFSLFMAPESVKHASLVLNSPIYAHDSVHNEEPLEVANPVFDEMMVALAAFERKEKFASING